MLQRTSDLPHDCFDGGVQDVSCVIPDRLEGCLCKKHAHQDKTYRNDESEHGGDTRY